MGNHTISPKTDHAGYACCVICGLIIGIIFTATLLKTIERKVVIHTQPIDKMVKDTYIREDCPTDWISYNNKCIHLSTEQKTWEEGRNACKALNPNSDLINIETPSELSFLRSLRKGYWVGESEILNQTSPYKFIPKKNTTIIKYGAKHINGTKKRKYICSTPNTPKLYSCYTI
ncbi:secreted glycoprotein [Akhmeta virus]|uniref:Lectin-like protein n=1 Tax=Orthopoxvirus akhmetapox TaxID=2200830 RepID=A0A346FSD5_9POXV|nr:secreted glycoprotein [Akhmeta virus]AXN74958.1 secreted glycoprotein [Akhmeta virus]AXN75178.1 secreted glycoprotein [Akhmeta virus]QEQ49504.1 lectin-like protein [Akhmeta virus]